MLKVALCCILFVWFWTPLYGVQLPKVSKLKRELSDQQMGFEEELAQQHKPLMNMKHGLGREKREEDALSCSAIKRRDDSVENGEYILMKDGRNVTTFCDMNTTGAAWTVFQRRISASVSFNRNWTDYKIGFGNLAGNFWWGNDNLAAFTSNGSFVLRVDVKDADGDPFYAEYQNFYIENEDAKYRLHLGTFSGNLNERGMNYNNGEMFSTPDQDNERDSSRHCAQINQSGWWFPIRCGVVRLNGVYTGTRGDGISYWDIREWKNYKWTEMKFRSM